MNFAKKFFNFDEKKSLPTRLKRRIQSLHTTLNQTQRRHRYKPPYVFRLLRSTLLCFGPLRFAAVKKISTGYKNIVDYFMFCRWVGRQFYKYVPNTLFYCFSSFLQLSVAGEILTQPTSLSLSMPLQEKIFFCNRLSTFLYFDKYILTTYKRVKALHLSHLPKNICILIFVSESY